MAIGDTGKYGWNSYVGVGEETTYGTAVTATSFVCFTSSSVKKEIERQKIDCISGTQNYRKTVQLNESVGGSLEAHLDVGADGLVKLIKQAFGGTVTTATITAGAYAHTISEGNMEDTGGTKAITLDISKGGTSFVYAGCRVNQMTISGNVGEPVMVSFDVVGKSGTLGAASVTVAYSTVVPVLFSGVTIKNADNIGSISSGTAETFQSFEFTLANNLDSSEKARALGSRTVSILPPAKRDVSLSLTHRFDTTTAYTRFTGNENLAFQIHLDSAQTITAGGSTYSMDINVARAYFDSNDFDVSDSGILQQTLPLTCIYDATAGYCTQAIVRNATATY